jgi:hypothetical protein
MITWYQEPPVAFSPTGPPLCAQASRLLHLLSLSRFQLEKQLLHDATSLKQQDDSYGA